MDGLMTVCHDARKGRTIGSHWPNHVRASAPLDHLYSRDGIPPSTARAVLTMRFHRLHNPMKTSPPIRSVRIQGSGTAPPQSASTTRMNCAAPLIGRSSIVFVVVAGMTKLKFVQANASRRPFTCT